MLKQRFARLLPTPEAAMTPRFRGPRLAPPALMNLGRFEAFSDAVFAIAITLLVLNFRTPSLDRARTASEALARLLALWPDFLGYVTSFVVIGVLWINHHALFHFLRRVDRVSLVINLLLLMCVAFIPFPTALVARYGHLTVVVVLFGLTMTITGVLFSALWFYAVRQYRRTDKRIDTRFIRDASIWTAAYPAAYASATALAFASPGMSLTLYILIPVVYLFPGVIDRQLHSDMNARSYAQHEAAALHGASPGSR